MATYYLLLAKASILRLVFKIKDVEQMKFLGLFIVALSYRAGWCSGNALDLYP
jgi:hypothetical protein